MLKFLFTAVITIFLIRLLMRLLFGGVHIRIEKYHYHHHRDDRSEGQVSLDTKKKKHNSDIGTAGEYVDFEELN
jgi:hypothetical protein